MRKILAVFLTCFILGGLLAGCGGGSGGDQGATPPPGAGGESSGEKRNMTMILSARDEFLSTLEVGAKEAANKLGVNLTTQDANNDSSLLLQYIEASRNAGEDAIIINVVDPETVPQCIEAAGDMKVVFVNRQPTDNSLLTENAVYVGSREVDAGHYQAEYLANYFKEQGKSEIKYILLNGQIGNDSTTNRTIGVLEGLESAGITATEASAPLAADWDRAEAMNMISPLLTTTDFDCIISNNDAMALGAIEALLSQGIDPKNVPVVGSDATVDGRQAIKDGTLNMTNYQNANGQGFASLQAAINLLEGNPVNENTGFDTDADCPYIVWVPYEPVTIDNVADFD
ncbi:hypothetical protein D3Z52_15045 [Clostridiaceae bacterium]|nr:hypothetical protein [Clostridiaceae bacterium]